MVRVVRNTGTVLTLHPFVCDSECFLDGPAPLEYLEEAGIAIAKELPGETSRLNSNVELDVQHF